MRYYLFLLMMTVMSFACNAESISEVLAPFKSSPHAVCVNIMDHPEFIAEVEKAGGENAEIFKSLKSFETIQSTATVEGIDSVAQILASKIGMTEIYNHRQEKSDDSTNNQFRNLIKQMLPIFDYISAYALKSGDIYTDFVYLIHIAQTNLGIIAYVQGNLTEAQLKYALPQVDTNYTINEP